MSQKKRYKVVGQAPACGHKTGETFEADLPQKKEERMIARGAIEVVTTAPSSPPSGTPGDKDKKGD